MKDNKGLVINNRQINYKYDIVETFEAGIELKGTEVKSIRDSLCNLKDSFAIINNNEVIVKGIHISPYEKGNINNVGSLIKKAMFQKVLICFGEGIEELFGVSIRKSLK